MGNYLIEADRVIISLEKFKQLEKSEETLQTYLEQPGVLEIGWYNGWAKYHSKEEFDSEIKDRLEKEVNFGKMLKKSIDKIAKMSILKFWKFKQGYPYMGYP